MEAVESDRLILVFIGAGETFLILCPSVNMWIRLVVPPTIKA